MSKPNSSGLTTTFKSSIRRETLLRCFDTITTHRHALETLAGLLEHCGERDGVCIRAETVRNAGIMMQEEIGQMRENLRRLQALTLHPEAANAVEK